MADLGFKNADLDQLVQFRIHGVSLEFIKAFADLGYKNLDAGQLVTMQFFSFFVFRHQVDERLSLFCNGEGLLYKDIVLYLKVFKKSFKKRGGKRNRICVDHIRSQFK